MRTPTVETGSIQLPDQAGARATVGIWSPQTWQAMLNATTGHTGMSRCGLEPLTWWIGRGFDKRRNEQFKWQQNMRLIKLFRLIQQPRSRQEWPQEPEAFLAWCRPYVMSVCQRILKGLVRCLITQLTYSPGHGLTVMRWLWSYWRSGMQQWPSISL